MPDHASTHGKTVLRELSPLHRELRRASVPAGEWCPGHPAAPRQGKLARLLRRR